VSVLPAHRGVRERRGDGRARRRVAPRGAHGDLRLPADRDPVLILQREAEGRVPELVPLRHARMGESAFGFFRGSAAVMAADLAEAPHSGLLVQLCGDAHLANFGGYASPERRLVFDVNDFDETLPGPFEWDVKRLAASFELAARERGVDDRRRAALVLGLVRGYREAMRAFAQKGNLAVWYDCLDADALLAELRGRHEERARTRVQLSVAKARRRTSLRALARLTHAVDGDVRFVSDPPVLVPIAELADPAGGVDAALRELFRRYRTSLEPDRRRLLDGFTYVDLARKVVGVGSVGTRCWVVLLRGRDDRDVLMLQVKEAGRSVLPVVRGVRPPANDGQRVVQGQRLVQAASDLLLGWVRSDVEPDGIRRDYYVRQLWDWKTSLNVETLGPRGLELYAGACSWTLARGHARSGDRVAIDAYLGRSDRFDRAVLRFSAAYADLAEHDHAAFVAAVQDGRLDGAGEVTPAGLPASRTG
jgi:uncharacterized protein (DUF2252 family)